MPAQVPLPPPHRRDGVVGAEVAVHVDALPPLKPVLREVLTVDRHEVLRCIWLHRDVRHDLAQGLLVVREGAGELDRRHPVMEEGEDPELQVPPIGIRHHQRAHVPKHRLMHVQVLNLIFVHLTHLLLVAGFRTHTVAPTVPRLPIVQPSPSLEAPLRRPR